MNRPDLARAIRDAALLRGEFILRSGATSSLYWDKYRFESNPALLAAVTAELQRLLPPSFDRLAGLELGGIPLATALSLQTSKPALYVRKAPKEYGTRNLVEGGFQPGERVIIVEDVITSGGQVVLSVRELRDLGLIADHAICVIDREQGGRENLAVTGCTLSTVFTMSQLENA